MALLKLDIEPGPVMRTSLDVLELAVDLIEIIPEWNRQDRDELANRAKALQEVCLKLLKDGYL